MDLRQRNEGSLSTHSCQESGFSRKRVDWKRGALNKQKVSQSGGVMAEFIVVLPMLLLIALGCIQWAFIYEAKVTVDHATFMAARAGSVTGADIGEMRNAFAKGILPLYSPDKDAPLGLDAGAGLKAWKDSRHWGSVNVGGGATQMLIINPTREAFDDYGEQDGGDTVIRNDRLHLKSMDIVGGSGVSVQDANLLKVHVLYGYEMKLPFIGGVLTWIGVRSTSNVAKQAMWRAGRIPVLSTSTVRMQSDAKLSSNVLAMEEVDQLLVSDSLPLINGHSYGGHRPWQMGPSGGDDGSFGLGGIGDLILGVDGIDVTGTDPGDSGDDGNDGDDGDDGDTGGDDGGTGGITCPPDDATCDEDDGDDDLGSVDCDDEDGGGGGGGDTGGRGTSSGLANSSGLNGTGGVAQTSQAMNLPSVMVGNPVNVVTGNKYQAEVDLRGVIPFVRHYNSQTSHKGAMGHNWRHSYEMRVRPVLSAGGDTHFRLTQADGRTISFKEGTEINPVEVQGLASVKGVYSARMPRDGVLVDRGSQGYDWIRESAHNDQSVLEFSDAGFLTAIATTRKGTEQLEQRTQLLYDASGQQLMAVAGPDGERLGLSYYKSGRLKKLSGAQGNETRFSYDDNSNLKSVEYSDNKRKNYYYEDSVDKHNLTGISNAEGERIATYAYDENDRATYSAHGDQTETVSLVYNDAQKLETGDDLVRMQGSTEVTDGSGVTSTYVTELRGGIPLVTEIRGPGCDTCSAGDVSYEYNEKNQVTRVNYKDGSARVNSYDDLGRMNKRESVGVSGSTTLVAEYAYVGKSNAIQKVTRPSVNPKAERTLEIFYMADGQPDRALENSYTNSQDGEFSPVTKMTNYDYSDGKLVGVEKIVNGVSQRTQYGYDDKGRLNFRERPGGSRIEIQVRNAQGQPTQFSALVPSIKSQIGSQSVAQAQNYSIEYDSKGGLASITDGTRSYSRVGLNAPVSLEVGGPGGFSASGDSDIERSVAMLEFNQVLSDLEGFEAAEKALDNGGVDDPALGNALTRDDCDENEEECAQIATGLRYGELSECIYDPQSCSSPNISDEWQAVDPSELGLEEDDFLDGGFAAGVYQSSETGEYTLVFRGTDNASDWIDNLGQGAGFTTSQYEMAVELARAVRDGLPPGANINVTGHSLGGGLATAAALELGVPAVVFNAAGLNPTVAADLNLDMSQANNLIDLYHVEGEILTSAQDLGPITIPLPVFPFFATVDGPSAPGTRFSLPPPSDEWMDANTSDAWYLPDALERAIQLHLMTSVMQSLNEQYEALGCE